METQDYITLIISFLSFTVAALSMYLANLKKSFINISIGRTAHIYHPSDGGTAIYLDIHLLNELKVKGKVKKIYLEIINEHNESYKLAWRRKCGMDSNKEYYNIANSETFFIDSHSYSDELYWFWFPPNSQNELIFGPGKYLFRLYYWQGKRKKPTISDSRQLVITKKIADFLKEMKQHNDPTTWIIPFEEIETIAMLSNPDDQDWWKKIK